MNGRVERHGRAAKSREVRRAHENAPDEVEEHEAPGIPAHGSVKVNRTALTLLSA